MTTFRSCALPTSVALAFLAGCTAIHVEALPRSEVPVSHVCIAENPAVIVRDFLNTLIGGFQRHGFTSETFTGTKPENCDVVVTYTARQSWDIVTYLVKAEIWMRRDGRQIAYAEYHLRGGGGYALTKYEGTATKMKPVMDQLLVEYPAPPSAAVSTL
ncbi:MAG TPA: Sbal_3080 family lipoprotein [Candidatus Limnocylindrales bacterium]|nr:Sbal_3080 family lipoprotein [Candidatus Limnocylindrales bacterium]